MLYLANPCTEGVRAAMRDGHLGCIITPAQGNRLPEGVPWAADNGRYGRGWPGHDTWWEWLKSVGPDPLCLFATAPDVVGDAAATLAESAPWLPRIRSLGYPAALVAQDGLTEPPWGDFDVLFIGGTTNWKLGHLARALVGEAKRRGVHVHMGRVNSARRYRYARDIGCDSADGTYLTFGPDRNLPRLLSWTRPTLFAEVES